MSESLPDHTLDLARELLADIELSRLPVDALVLKSMRLARALGNEEVMEWLTWETTTIPSTERGKQTMELTGRWADKDAGTGYWQGACEVEAMIRSYEQVLTHSRMPDLSGDAMFVTAQQIAKNQIGTAKIVNTLTAIRSKVVARIHAFVSTQFYELNFANEQATMFDAARTQVDALLAPLIGKELLKIESIYKRLGEGDVESISQALSTCRRLIDATADAIYPAKADPVMLDEVELKATKSHVLNRMNLFVAEQIDSKSRRAKLRRSLADIYDRVSAGVHDDVPGAEARFLFLGTYILLGEILSLPRESEPEDLTEG